MKLLPSHDNIFVEKDKQEEKRTSGGILLPADAQQTPDTATVIAVGPGRLLLDGSMVIPLVVPGQQILLSRYSGTEVNWGEEKRIVVPWGDVLGIVVPECEDAVPTKDEEDTRPEETKASIPPGQASSL